MYELSLVVLMFAGLIVLHDVRKCLQGIVNIMQKNYDSMYSSIEKDESNEGLSSYEIERIEREREFDNRIEELQRDIDGASGVNNSGNMAEVLEDGVYNIPHHEINLYPNNGGQEIAD